MGTDDLQLLGPQLGGDEAEDAYAPRPIARRRAVLRSLLQPLIDGIGEAVEQAGLTDVLRDAAGKPGQSNIDLRDRGITTYGDEERAVDVLERRVLVGSGLRKSQ